MSAAREKDTADYDLEHFIMMFDAAMTSNDPRVKQALRQLMMMVILTDSSDHEAKQRASHGPLRQLVDDVQQLIAKVHRLESEIQSVKYRDRNQASNYKWPNVPDGYQLGGQGGALHPQTAMSEMHQAAIKQKYHNMIEQVEAEKIAKKINSGSI